MKKIDKQVASWIKSSHERQFQGEDYQAICWDFLNSKQAESLGLTADDDGIWEAVESAPHPDCKCGFCEFAAWE